eukprot:TRINITY_DN43322_c0_g1_i1.p1 TRINITY_DN43322_c0_g1~~TRINITY_DN43322_c0_g1_i1.p1  ORF type:complete len:227 (+),score=54.01 TRINITY_DN43322_c0_g1_i1:98-778(+)
MRAVGRTAAVLAPRGARLASGTSDSKSAVTWKRAGDCVKVFDTDKELLACGAGSEYWQGIRWQMKQGGGAHNVYDNSKFTDTPPEFPKHPLTAQKITAWRAEYDKWLAELGRLPQDGHGRPAERQPYLSPADHQQYLAEVFAKLTPAERAELGASDKDSPRVGRFHEVFDDQFLGEKPEGWADSIDLNRTRPLLAPRGPVMGCGWFLANSKHEFVASATRFKSSMA